MVNAFMKLVGNELVCKRITTNPLKIFFFFVFEPNLKKVPGATFKIAKCVQKFFLAFLAVHHLTIFIPSFKDIFEFFKKSKLVISDELRSFGHTFTCKASSLREVVIHTVASY